MTKENDFKKRREILNSLFLKEEDVIAKLERLVKLAEPYLRIEINNNRVILLTNFDFTNSEKIFLILLGKYFALQYGSLDSCNMKVTEISEELGGIPVNTLSSKISILSKNRVLTKPTQDTYQVNPHEIESFLKKINDKYQK